MQRFDLITKLKAAEDQVLSLSGDIKTFVTNFVETNRKFKNGQKVEVFDFEGKSYGIGFVKGALCGVDFRWGFRTSKYLGKEEYWLKDLSDITYMIVKSKKDGTPSERVLMWDKPRQEKTKDRYHLIAVE